MKTNEIRNNIIENINKWIRTNSMIHLAEALYYIFLFLNKEKFPITKYIKDKKNEKIG